MPRGSKNFDKLISDTTDNPIIERRSVPSKKGRCAELNQKRDELICTRYWYYAHYTYFRYEMIIARMVDEFLISGRRIADILQADNTVVSELKKDKPRLKDLRIMYPHWVWKSEK